MFRSPFTKEPTDLENAIARLHEIMRDEEPMSEEYQICIKHLKSLEKLKNNTRSRRPSPDAMLAAGGSILGILIIVAYEHSHVLTSKSLSFLLKPKT